MVRNYIRKTDKASYSDRDLQAALSAVTSGEMSKRQASKQFGIPRPTIIKRLKNPGHTLVKLGRFKWVFDAEFEKEIIEYALEMQKQCYSLSVSDPRWLAIKLAERNGISHSFSRKTMMARKEWSTAFLKRHKELSLCSPEATSMVRITGFNKVQVDKFFNLLREVMSKNEFRAHQIFNTDESGITTVQKPGKILAKRGLKRAVSYEKGMTTTIVCAMSPIAVHVPSVMLFCRKNMNARLMKGALPVLRAMHQQMGEWTMPCL